MTEFSKGRLQGFVLGTIACCIVFTGSLFLVKIRNIQHGAPVQPQITQVRIAWKSFVDQSEGHGNWFDESEKEDLLLEIREAEGRWQGKMHHWLQERKLMVVEQDNQKP